MSRPNRKDDAREDSRNDPGKDPRNDPDRGPRQRVERADKQNLFSTDPREPLGEPPRAEKMPEYVSARQPAEGDAAAEREARNADREGRNAKSAPPEDRDAGAERTKRGRPPVFNQFLKAKVVGLITAGVSQRTAAAFVHIHPSTISKAIQRDRAFRLEIERAVAAARVLPLLKIIKASDSSWRAAAWLLKNAQPATDLTERRAEQQRHQGNERWEEEGLEWFDRVCAHVDDRKTDNTHPDGASAAPAPR